MAAKMKKQKFTSQQNLHQSDYDAFPYYVPESWTGPIPSQAKAIYELMYDHDFSDAIDQILENDEKTGSDAHSRFFNLVMIGFKNLVQQHHEILIHSSKMDDEYYQPSQQEKVNLLEKFIKEAEEIYQKDEMANPAANLKAMQGIAMEAWYHMTKMEHLSWSGSDLAEDYKKQPKTLPESLSLLKKLEHAYLMDNGFTNIPVQIGKLQNLYWLYLEKNKIEFVPEQIGHLSELSDLTLNENNIHALPDAFANMQSLKEINLYNNPLTEFPPSFFALKNLTHLGFDCNFNQIPKEISQLKSLEKLAFKGKKIKAFPEELCELKNLREISIWDTSLSTLPKGFEKLTSLKVLILAGNQFKTIPDQVYGLAKLEILHLGENQISNISADISLLDKLQILGLRNNKFTEIPEEITYLRALQSLFIENNPLETLPHAIKDLQNLTRIGISNTNIKEIPAGMVQLPKVEEVEAYQSMIEEYDLLNLFPNAIISYSKKENDARGANPKLLKRKKPPQNNIN